MNTTSRRQFVLAGIAASVGLALPRQLWAQTAAAIDPAKRDLLVALCDLVIPATATPGAVGAGVPDFLPLALQHGLASIGAPAGSPIDDSAIIDRLQKQLDRKGAFAKLPVAEQLAILTPIDAAAFAPNAPVSDWQRLKTLIIVGYYTSEIGGEKELQYDLVPGEFDPDLPMKPNARAWSNDWTAVDFS